MTCEIRIGSVQPRVQTWFNQYSCNNLLLLISLWLVKQLKRFPANPGHQFSYTKLPAGLLGQARPGLCPLVFMCLEEQEACGSWALLAR